MTKLCFALLAALALAGCANADGSRPRLSPNSGGTAAPAGFGGAYGGGSGGFSTLNSTRVPF